MIMSLLLVITFTDSLGLFLYILPA